MPSPSFRSTLSTCLNSGETPAWLNALPTPSTSSSLNWTLRDSAIRGGWILFGLPGEFVGDPCPPAYVAWTNNVFDHVAIFAQPSSYSEHYPSDPGYSPEVDFPFFAYNNLFRQGSLELEPQPTSAGNWSFNDNIFDHEYFQQCCATWRLNQGAPLFATEQDLLSFDQANTVPFNFDHNAYWPYPVNEVINTWLSSAIGPALNPMTGQGGTTGDDVTLTTAPVYRAGPFGNYYLNAPVGTDSSQTAAAAGLYHYTQSTNLQSGAEIKNTSSLLPIGPQYIAAANNAGAWTPIDTDGDGIPDYVENWHGDGNTTGVGPGLDAGETDWKNAHTETGISDTINPIYNDLDLSGNGIAGRIKQSLGVNALSPATPLTMTQILTGQEPDVVTFTLNANYTLVTNSGKVNLLVDGDPADFVDCEPSSGGLCTLTWNTTFTPPGNHSIQAQFVLNQQLTAGPSPDPTVVTAIGPLDEINADNGLQFDPFYCAYSATYGAVLYAQLAEPDAEYTIEIVSPTGQHIRWLSASEPTSTGLIDVPWDLKYDDGETAYTGISANAIFNVTLQNSGSYTHVLTLNELNDLDEGAFTVAYTWDDYFEAIGDLQNVIQDDVVDLLLEPCNVSFCYTPYPYAFDNPDGVGGKPYAGFLNNQADANNLINNLTNLSVLNTPTRNFFFFGHGNQSTLGDGPRGQVRIDYTQIFNGLGNKNFTLGTKEVIPAYQYRFVFLDACATANDTAWAHAFGIYRRITTSQLSYWPERAQAFVGWVNESHVPGPGDLSEMSGALSVFFAAWQSGIPLSTSIWYASQYYPPDPFTGTYLGWNFGPGVQHWNFLQKPYFGNDPFLRIYGYAGLTRTGFAPGYDQSPYYR